MTVGELKKALEDYDEESVVIIRNIHLFDEMEIMEVVEVKDDVTFLRLEK